MAVVRRKLAIGVMVEGSPEMDECLGLLLGEEEAVKRAVENEES